MLYKISCKHCGGRISFEENPAGAVVQCPHCNQSIELTVPVETQPGTPVSPPKKKSSIALIGVLVVAVVVAAGAIFFFVARNSITWVKAENLQLAPAFVQGDVTVSPAAAEPMVVGKSRKVQVTFTRGFSVATLGYCEVTFLKDKPAPAEVDKLVQQALQKCAEIDPAQEIVAMAFLKNEALKKTDYSGALVWKPAEKIIQLFCQ